MATVRVNGIDIWYERSGGAGPTLVLTHGFAGPSRAGWPSIINDFRTHFDLLLYDVRAHGDTGMPDDPATVTMPQFAADLAGLLDALDIERPHVAGISMGGMVSAQFACDYPDRVRSLALCDTVAGNAAQRPDSEAGISAAADAVERQLGSAFERFHHIVEKYGVEGVVERENRYRRDGSDPYAHLSAMSLDEQDEKNYRTKIEHMTKEGYLAAAHAVLNRPDISARTPLIKAPTLVSCGEWDLFYPCALRDHAAIKGSRFVTIRGAAHSTPDYRPQLWKRAIFDFIADVEAGRDVAGEFELAE